MSTLSQKIEALLFVQGNAISISKLCTMLGAESSDVESAIEELKIKYGDKSGVVIMELSDTIRLATNPLIGEDIQGLLQKDITGELTRPQLETLTIIAYRAPVIKGEIEMIRGVNCTLILRNLLQRALIEENEGDHGEIVYRPSTEFMGFLGVRDLSELPDFEKLSAPDLVQRLAEATSA